MKVYIQEIETGRYFKNPFVWVDQKSAAYNFVTSLEAFDFCLQMTHRRGTRILLSFEDPEHDICLFSFEPEQQNGKAEELHPAVPQATVRTQESELIGVG